MAADERKRQMHGWVSEEALAGWRGFARAHNTNVTALMEALGQQFAAAEEQPAHRLPAVLRDVVRHAQQLAGSRSTRTRTPE